MPVRRPRALSLVAVAAVVTVLAGCGGGSSSSGTSARPSATTAVGAGIVNVWKGPAADLTRLPLGTTRVSLTTATVGGLYACDAGNPSGGGAQVAGPWIDQAAGTWDATKKPAVQGDVDWPSAHNEEQANGDTRSFSTNGLPLDATTGIFPIASSDPAYAYDRNPNRIGETTVSLALPLTPTPAATPACLGKDFVGYLRNGVVIFAPLDEANRDAVAYEVQDHCDGHPQQSGTYHYHDIPSCIRRAAKGPSTVVGFALDGYPIVVERDASGALPTNADLDECHGRTSPIALDGAVVTTYHYSATSEFPYFIGCYHGVVPTSAVTNRSSATTGQGLAGGGLPGGGPPPGQAPPPGQRPPA